jgi:hypothetical protein
MRAICIQREDLRAGFDEQHILIADMADELAVDEVRDSDALR